MEGLVFKWKVEEPRSRGLVVYILSGSSLWGSLVRDNVFLIERFMSQRSLDYKDLGWRDVARGDIAQEDFFLSTGILSFGVGVCPVSFFLSKF